MTKRTEYQLRDAVKLRGMSGIISAVALTEKDEIFFVFRDEQNRTFHACRDELESA